MNLLFFELIAYLQFIDFFLILRNFFHLKSFKNALKCCISENEKLLKDFEIYGLDNKKFIIVICGPEWSDFEKRKNYIYDIFYCLLIQFEIFDKFYI